MRLLLLVNASASSVTARTRVVIAKALSADHDVTVAETSRRGHASRLARGAAAEGIDCVVALGGDGTLNEAANGLAGSATSLAVLPGGSTNVFARSIGVANDPIEATAQVLAALGRGAIEPVGLGVVNGRYFLFHVGMGFDAAVVQHVEQRADLKRWAGHPLFVYAGFATWFRHYDRHRPRMAVHATGRPVVDDSYLTICLNTSPYTFLGNRPLDIAPDARLDAPLVLVSLRSMALLPLLAVLGASLGVGRPVPRRRSVAYQTEVREAEVRGYGPFPYQVDGDYLGDVEELRLRHEPAALRLVMAGAPGRLAEGRPDGSVT